MEQLVKVYDCSPDGTARVMVVRQSACSGDCHKCSGCGAVTQTMLLTARNPIGAVPGDLVRIESASAPVLKAAAMLYILPLFLFIAGYLVGMQWQLGGLVGGGAFVLGILMAVLYDRRVVKKEDTVYTIIGYGKTSPRPKE